MYSQLTSDSNTMEEKIDKEPLEFHIAGRIPKSLHSQLSKFCANEERTISDAIRLALKEYLLFQNKPNLEL